MSLKNLSNEDQAIILQCMKCILQGPYISEEEFETRLGISRNELEAIIEHWREIDDFRVGSSARLAVNNCLNEICHGISFSTEDWGKWFKTTRSEIRNTFKRFERG